MPVAIPSVPSATSAANASSRAARRRVVVGLIVAATLATLLTVAVSTGSEALHRFDTAITTLTRGWADPLGWPVDVTHVIGLVTAPFWSALAAAALVVTLLLAQHRAAAGLLAISGIAGVTVSETVKASMGRARPPGAEQFEPDLDKSFPSGHAMEGIYLYMAAGLVLIHLGRTQGSRPMVLVGRTLVVIGPLIGVSRLILGVHWPSDTLAGWAFGSVVLLTSALILWWPLDGGWDAHVRPAQATPPAPPAAGTTPARPAR